MRFALGVAAAAGIAAAVLPARAGVPWDVAPVVAGAAAPPLVCPGGGNGTDVADALVVLRRAVGIITGFKCGEEVIGDGRVDVAPPAAVDFTASPPRFVAGGDGVIDAADALLLLRASIALVQLVAAPDLTFVGGMSASPLPLLAGVGGTLLATVVSRDAASDPVMLCAYGADPTSVPRPSPLGCTPLAAFAAGEVRLVAVDIVAPPATGFLPFWLVVDDADQTAELDEGNNVLGTTLRVAEPPPAQPDLAFPVFGALRSVPVVPLPGQPLTLETVLRNQGTAPVTQPFALDFFFDRPRPPLPGECGDVFFREAKGVPAGGEIAVKVETGLGASVAPGPHVLWATVDGGLGSCGPPEPIGDVLEINESNNTSPRLDLCVGSGVPKPADRVDLRAGALVPSFGGNTFSVRAEFSNAGPRDVVPFAGGFPQPAVFARLRISVFGAQPQELELDIPCFVSGATAALASDALPLLAVPARVEFDLDPGRQIPESDDGNNRKCILVNQDKTIDPC
jgi:hypothetical protein